MENFIKILEIITWPIITVIAMILFRNDLRKVLGRLSKVETSAAKMMFNEDMKEVESNIPKVVEETANEGSSWLKEMISIAKLNPRAAIIEAWTTIEVACLELGMVQGATMPRFSPKVLEEFLHKIPDFDSDMIKRVMDLRRLRNRVTHGMDADFDYIDAEKYIELANQTVCAINAHK